VIPTVITVIAIATYTDCRWRIIKNTLTLPAIVLGLFLHFLGSGWPGLTFALLGLAVGFTLMMIPFVFGQMGGGDVKLMAALGSLLGAYAVMNVFLYTTLAGGLLALGFAIFRKQGFHTLRQAWQLAKGFLVFQSLPDKQSEPEPAATMPYGLAIAVGTLAYLTLGNIV
jgi:prepilin peptidase CpaA